ncbi:MAG: transcriptional activator NhaR [Acidobacteriota bacterium]
MEWLNYHHLLYFWTVAREGGVARAADKLRVSQPTVSAQVRALEQALGERLFQKEGRRLVLTEVGRTVTQFADDIFSLGQELLDTVHDRPTGRPLRLNVGVTDVVPKLLAYRLIAPALTMATPVRVVCREGKPEPLFAELAIHALDLVVADAPVPSGVRVRVHNHAIGESGVSFFAGPALARRLKGRFPRNLDGAPLLLPSEGSALRRPLEQWLDQQRARPVIVGEFDDSALMKSFGEAGVGVFVAPSLVGDEVKRQYNVRQIGETDQVRERLYAVTAERKVKHEAVLRILDAVSGRR